MIQASTILNVADNSGAKKVNCIAVLGGYKKKTASVGDVIVASIREMRRQGPGQIWKVKKGDVIQRGDIIAKVGNTGKSTAPHLHYEVRLNGEHVNPNNYYFN